MKALHALGVIIHLHCFEYGRGQSKELDKYCENVFYYERSSSLKNIFSRIPFRIKSRSSSTLISNLKKIKGPILFEGLHSTYSLIEDNFNDRKIIVRTHNIEHLYHQGLYKSEKQLLKKVFFKSEALRLAPYESILHKATNILTISPFENTYFKNKYGDKATYIPAFHRNPVITELSEQGDYALYHGDLRVADNKRAFHFLIEIFEKVNYPLIIASSFKEPSIIRKIDKLENVQFVQIKDSKTLEELLKNAHINVLPTFQKTGIKLKLINALFSSRFCIVNNEMIKDTGLEDLCIVCETKEEFSTSINNLVQIQYTDKERVKRTKSLKKFDVNINAKKIIDLIY